MEVRDSERQEKNVFDKNAVPVTLYTNTSLVTQARIHFEQAVPQSITLYDFFSPMFYSSLKQSIFGLHFSSFYDPTHARFGISTLGASQAVFEHADVARALVDISGALNVKVLGAFCFSSGSYTILSDDGSSSGLLSFFDGKSDFSSKMMLRMKKKNEKLAPRTLAIFDFSSEWDPTWGGRDVFVDGTGNFVYVPIKGNTVTIVSLLGLQHFVEYVNHYAEDRKRFVVLCELV